MATLKEIEGRIDDHSRRLAELHGEKNNSEKIRVTQSLIKFWEGQKKKVTKAKNLQSK